jgi:hypothetical protein
MQIDLRDVPDCDWDAELERALVQTNKKGLFFSGNEQ